MAKHLEVTNYCPVEEGKKPCQQYIPQNPKKGKVYIGYNTHGVGKVGGGKYRAYMQAKAKLWLQNGGLVQFSLQKHHEMGVGK